MSDEPPFLTIQTALKSPPLKLAVVKGAEGMSMPYTYEVTMVRYKGGGDFEPRELIGTACAFGIRQTHPKDADMPDPRKPEYIVRRGVFEHVERVAGTSQSRDHIVYHARIVPAFKLLARQSRYRIYENKDVTSIIESALFEEVALSAVPTLRVNTTLLRMENDPPLPTLDYCVQFGETTFAFVSRLMARYGMWYYFDHGADPDSNFENERNPASETLIIGRRFNRIKNAAHPTVALTDDEKAKGMRFVYNFVRRYNPPPHKVSVGNFNPLQPTASFEHGVVTSPEYSDQVATAETTQRFDETAFPEPVLSDDEAEQHARQIMRGKESDVYRVTGDGSEMSFRAGRYFTITHDKTDDHDVPTKRIFGGEKPTYLVTVLSFVATDGSFGRTFGNTIGDFFSILAKNFESGSDVLAHVAHGMLEGYLEKANEAAWEEALDPHAQAEAVTFFPAAMAGGTWAVAGPLVLANIYKAATQVAKGMESNYRNSFAAVPWHKDFERPVPVAAPRPIARGPHLAVVIGKNGAEPEEGDSDIWADALGRVRVRFPWDPGPGGITASRWTTGHDTCWVRVSEGWAGAGFGTQFLPRIGQQVLVDFIDGDPERPIIVGRVYSARSGFTGLPFPSPEARTKQLTIAEWQEPKTGSDQLQRSGIRTRSTPVRKNAKPGFHLLRLDDTSGKEQFLLRSQGRLDVTALGSYFETVHGARHTVIGGRDPKTGEGAGDCVTHVSGEHHLRVEQSRYEEVGKDYQFEVRGDVDVNVQGNVSSDVRRTASLSAGAIVLSAIDTITLKVGGTFVKLTPAGVYINGPLIYLNSGGPPPDEPSIVVLKTLQEAKRADAGES